MNQDFELLNEDLCVSNNFEILKNLISAESINESWLDQVEQTASRILKGLLIEDYKNMPLLETFANLISRCPDKRNFFENFAYLVLLHLVGPPNFSHLKEALTHAQSNAFEPGFQVPKWWPDANGNNQFQNITSIFDLALNLETTVKSHAFEIHSITHIVSFVLCRLDLITRQQPAWVCFADLMSLMSKSVAHRDLTTLVLSQDEKAIDALLRFSVSSASVSGDRYAKFLVDLLSTRSTIIVSFSTLYELPGALRLVGSNPQILKPAFKVAADTPFRYIVDALNHHNDLLDFKNPTVSTCVSIATRNLELLERRKDQLAIYGAFNSVSNVNSLLSVITQFGCMIARGILEGYGDFVCSGRYFAALDMFMESKFPPLAKPNYFFIEQKSAPVSATLDMMARLDDYDELHRSLARTLKFLKMVIESEIDLAKTTVASRPLAEKLYSCTINTIYHFLFLALKCNEKQEQSLVSQLTSELILKIFGVLLSGVHSTLSWTILFSCATEMSYSEIDCVKIWLKFFGTLCPIYSNDSRKDLITDCFRRFSKIFDPPRASPEQSTNPYVSVPYGDTCVIEKSEYMFLYQDPSRYKANCEDVSHTRSSSHYSLSGRQQSVHVDKFGKDR